jgi:hypothetical protein
MGWTMFYLFVFLKLPLCALFYIVWWAIHQTGDEQPEGEGGARRELRPHPHGHPKLPRSPRRGPHGDPLPLPPPRVRPVSVRARELEER